jgi:sulfur-oxidizing protein SoxB
MSGEQIKMILEDVGDNLFNPDPYYQQGGDMVRVGGLSYTCNPVAGMGKRIEADKVYKVAGWAPVSEEARGGKQMIWDVVETWLKARGGKVAPRQLNMPKVEGVLPNPGYVAL